MTTQRGLSLLFAQLFGKSSAPKSDIRELTKAVNARLDDDRLRVRLADAHLATGNRSEAIIWYWEAARINARLDRSARAVALFKRVLALDPESVRALVELARAQETAECYREAARYYRAAARIRGRSGYREEAEGLEQRAETLERRNSKVRAAAQFPVSTVAMS